MTELLNCPLCDGEWHVTTYSADSSRRCAEALKELEDFIGKV